MAGQEEWDGSLLKRHFILTLDVYNTCSPAIQRATGCTRSNREMQDSELPLRRLEPDVKLTPAYDSSSKLPAAPGQPADQNKQITTSVR